MQPLVTATFLFAATLGTALAQTTSSLTAAPATAAPAQSAPATGGTGGGVTINALTGQLIPSSPNPSTAAATNSRAAVAFRPMTNAATASRSNITPVQMQNINRLAVDLNGLSVPSRDRAEQQRTVRETLLAAPISNTKPSAEAIGALGDRLATVVPSLNLTAAQRQQLAIDLNMALNSGNLNAQESQRVVSDLKSLLQGSAVHNPEGVGQLTDQIQSLVSQIQASAIAAASSSTPVTTVPDQAGRAGATQTGQGTGTSTPGTTVVK